METRLALYQKAIEELEQVKLKAVENEIKRMKLGVVGMFAIVLFVMVVFFAV